MAALCSAAWAETLRVATWHSELSRKHPTLLYRDITKSAPDVAIAARLIAQARPDILALQGFDYDHGAVALTAFAAAIRAEGWDLSHHFALSPNTGQMTDADLNGDGRTHDPQDAQGYGWFAGQGGMAVLSRYPVRAQDVQDFSHLIWADQPWATLPEADGAPFLTDAARAIMRLSTTGHWIVPVEVPGGILHLWTSHHTAPVFDGPEDRNGLRNADELRLWQWQIPTARMPFVLAGNFNLDPTAGEGLRAAVAELLTDPRLQDPHGPGPTARFGRDIGDLRVSYILPSACLEVVDQGRLWPEAGDLRPDRLSRHALVWVDLRLHSRCDG